MSIVCTDIDPDSAGNIAFEQYVRASLHADAPHVIPLPPDWKFEPVYIWKSYKNWAEQLYNFDVQPDDTYICCSMKTGSTWLEQIVWLLLNDLSYEKASKEYITKRTGFLEAQILLEALVPTSPEVFSTYQLPSPPCRVIKSHLPMPLLPKKMWSVRPKIIYITRDPKDTIVSLYHMCSELADLPQTIDEYAKRIINDKIVYAPFHQHVLSFWHLRNEDYVLFLTYEEMKRDPFAVIKKLSVYLNRSYSDAELQTLTEFVSFENLKKFEANLDDLDCSKESLFYLFG